MRPHENVVMLKGVCFNPYSIVTGLQLNILTKKEYVSKGSLSSYLGQKRLSRNEEVLMIFGIAKGLHHLHCENIS